MRPEGGAAVRRPGIVLLVVVLALPPSAPAAGTPGGPAGRASIPAVELPPSFPAGSYTPNGYIDNPFHSMVHNRSGVLRSYPPVALGWWRTDFPGAYGSGVRDHVNYVSLLHIGVALGDTVFSDAGDFARRGVDLHSKYHTKHVLSYDWTTGPVTASVRYFLPQEHTLACLVELTNDGPADRRALVHATHIYRLGEFRWWGRDGMTSRHVAGPGVSVVKTWAYGDVFVLGGSIPSAAHRATDDRATWAAWLRTPDTVSTGVVSARGRGPLYTAETFPLTVPAGGSTRLMVLLSRGPNERAAIDEYTNGFAGAVDSLRAQLTKDEFFWSRCPTLEGDWPAHWKRGWVYDFETLRMTLRPPLGIFSHPWDGMQVHSPRLVLGETALDMQTLAYADPDLAREVLLGTFQDAPAPNVPCVREDGSMNMISSDGSECGTAPMWGYPFQVIYSLFLRTADSVWAGSLYPYLGDYLDWWLKNRTDREGWLHCNNSWESGQDGSRRFLVAEGNEAAVADFVRTVDVEASMAEAMMVMARLAAVAGRPGDRAMWESRAADRIRRTRSMFVDGWFRDVDGRTRKPIILPDHVDVMMLAPLTCGVATEEQGKAVGARVGEILAARPDWIEWPPGLGTLCEAAWNGGFRAEAAEVVWRIADRAYRRTDSREVRRIDSHDPFSYRVPGVAAEFWPADETPAGGENYGWGATLPTHIIRTIAGFRETAPEEKRAFVLSPNLPAALVRPGATYRLTNLHFRGRTFDVAFECGAGGGLTVHLASRGKQGFKIFRQGAPGPVAVALQGVESGVTFPSEPREIFTVVIE